MMDEGHKAKSIRIEFEHGMVYTAEGKQAADIYDWYLACESMNCIHGAAYRGQKFTETKAEPAPAVTSEETIFKCPSCGELETPCKHFAPAERAAAWAAFQKHVGYPHDFEVFWRGWKEGQEEAAALVEPHYPLLAAEIRSLSVMKE